MRGLHIAATGRGLPKRQVTNEELSFLVDTSDEWIRTRTGIESRYVCDGESGVSLAVAAAQQALGRLEVKDPACREKIGVVVVATATPDYVFPSEACLVKEALGLTDTVMSFDISAACAGFLYGLEIVRSLLLTGKGTYGLLIGCEQMSKILDYTDRSTCILFGDGAGAALIQLDQSAYAHLAWSRGNVGLLNCPGVGLTGNGYGSPVEDSGEQATGESGNGEQHNGEQHNGEQHSGEQHNRERMEPCTQQESEADYDKKYGAGSEQENGAGSEQENGAGNEQENGAGNGLRNREEIGRSIKPENRQEKVFMEGNQVFRFAVKTVPEAIDQILEKMEMTMDEIDYVVCHQANARIIDGAAKKYPGHEHKFYRNIARYANTSAASIPIALDEMFVEGLLKPGMKIIAVGFGAGLTWSSTLITI